MVEFLQFCFAPANLFFSLLLGLVFLYWIIVVIGLLDMDFLDVDIDLDVEAEGEIEADAVPDAGGAFHAFMAFFYVGKVPLTILLTILISCMWFAAMIGNFIFNQSGSFIIGLPVGLAGIVASFFLLKFLAWPFAKIFSAMDSSKSELNNVLGKLCVVTSLDVSDKMGQAEVKTEGSPVIINAVTENGVTLQRGEEAVVLEQDKAKRVYVIAPVIMEK